MPSEDALLAKIIDGLKRMPYWQIGLFACLVLALALSAFLLIRPPGHAGIVVEENEVDVGAENPPEKIKIYVAGAVLRPGVYEMEEGARVGEALRLAGGASLDADMVALNLAERLHDGEKVAVPRIGETSGSSGGSASAEDGPVNLNTASVAELDGVPGIGPVLAERILDYRESHGGFHQVEELQQVEGIGPKTYEDLKDKVEV